MDQPTSVGASPARGESSIEQQGNRDTEGETVPAMLDSSVRIPPHVVSRAFATETVVLNLETGKYHGLNPSGARMLETATASPSIREAARELAGVYGRDDDEMQLDLIAFLTDLQERGLVEIVPTAPS
jgi:hypothetical protein